MRSKEDISDYVYIGKTGKLIFFAQDHPEYGCIPLIALKELDGNTDVIMWLYDMQQTYFDDDQKRLD